MEQINTDKYAYTPYASALYVGSTAHYRATAVLFIPYLDTGSSHLVGAVLCCAVLCCIVLFCTINSIRYQ